MHITHEGRTVAKAIALLDKKGPANWRDRVNLEVLNLTSPRYCVLGQVFQGPGPYFGSGYSRGLTVLKITTRMAIDGAFASNRYLDQWKKQLKKGQR